jgi:hypothetical protein
MIDWSRAKEARDVLSHSATVNFYIPWGSLEHPALKVKLESVRITNCGINVMIATSPVRDR